MLQFPDSNSKNPLSKFLRQSIQYLRGGDDWASLSRMSHIAPANNFTIVSQLDKHASQIRENIESDEGFWVGDISRVRESLSLWHENLPNIKMHYAVKCCDEYQLLRYLADHGIGFDCASKTEIEKMLSLNVEPSRIVFAHPIKSAEAIRYAKEMGIKRLVVDTIDELRKIMKYYPDCEIFLRVKPKFTNAKIQLSKKFGTAPEDVPALLSEIAEMRANFIGFSYHVGGLCDDVQTFRYALEYVSELKAKAETLGLKTTFIDIGGGFLSPNSPANVPFTVIAETIRRSIDDLFDDSIEVISEPGRFIAAEYMDFHLPVIGEKLHLEENGDYTQSIYIPDGIYGAFNALTYDHAEPHFEILSDVADSSELYETTMWGQTCDSADIVYTKMMFPRVRVGDVISVRKFGAYTYSPTSFFNGFMHKRVFLINEDD